MDINGPSESEEIINSLHSLSCASSSTIFQNVENNKTTEKVFFNRFMSFCETNIFDTNPSQYGNDITENVTSEEDITEQFLNENIEKPINKNVLTEKPINKNDLMENPLDENNFSEKTGIETVWEENPINNNFFTENPITDDFIENTINENNFIKKLMTEDDFIDKFLEKTTEKNAFTNANQKKKITKPNPNNVNPKRANVGKSVKITKTKAKNENEQNNKQYDSVCLECTNSAEPVAHIKLEVLDKLKQSTRKLITLLEKIQLKTHSCRVTNLTLENEDLADIIRSMPDETIVPSVVDVAVNHELKKLQQHTRSLDAIYVEEEKDDCSVYKRLTRKCVCLNRVDYNDFIIHFNEDSKFFTTNTGEIIKNMRILKKFMYIGGDYSKRAFMFLDEGLSTNNHIEKVEIILGFSHADMCNIFEDYSIVVTSISWPCKSEYYGNSLTQSLVASILLKLAQIEEGRRYLNYTSKIANDIKKVIRKKNTLLTLSVLECLNSILNLLQPPRVEHIGSVTYYCKAVEEGFGFKTVSALARYRKFLTLEEIFIHLDLIHNLSKTDCGKNELRKLLPVILSVFRNLLFEFDNSEMNIILTNIMNNIISRNILDQNSPGALYKLKPVAMAQTATDAIEMKHDSNQIPIKKNNKPKNRSKGFSMPTTKFRETSRRKFWELSPKPSAPLPPPPSTLPPPPARYGSTQRLKKHTKNSRNNSVIVVPMEKQKNIFWV